MRVFFAGATPGNLVPGLSYLIIAAQRVPTESGMRLFLKLRETPQNIFCKMQGDLNYLFSDYQIEQINKQKLFVNLSFWGNHYLVIRLYRQETPPYLHLLIKRWQQLEFSAYNKFSTPLRIYFSLNTSHLTLLSFTPSILPMPICTAPPLYRIRYQSLRYLTSWGIRNVLLHMFFISQLPTSPSTNNGNKYFPGTAEFAMPTRTSQDLLSLQINFPHYPITFHMHKRTINYLNGHDVMI
jgi:hypothetical protein